MSRRCLTGLVVAVSIALGLTAETGATSTGSAVSPRVPALAAARPDGTDAVMNPIDSFLITAWHFNPATGHYYAQVENLTWTQAEAYAVRVGGHLVTINDRAEEDWLIATFGLAGQAIGFNDLDSDGTWSWSSGEDVTYAHYPPGQPQDDGPPPENVTGFEPDPDGDGVWWADLSAGDQYPALVEVPVEPTTGWIAGTVTAGGSPVSGIRVEALAQEPGGAWRAAGSATTDASGAYEIGDLPPAGYWIVFRGGAKFADQHCAKGMPCLPEWEGQGQPDPGGTVSVTAGNVVSDINGELALRGTITGRVTDGASPIGGIIVLADVPTPGGIAVAVATAETAADGTYTLAGLGPAAYRVRFEDPDGQYPAGVYINALDLNSWAIEVGPGAVVRGIDAVMKLPGLAASPAITLQAAEWRLNPGTGHYYAQLEDAAWAEAEAHAVRLGGHLVTINDRAEEEWLVATFGLQSQLIGFNDLASEGTWVWSSGASATYTNWSSGFPEIPASDAGDVARLAVSGELGWYTAPASGDQYPALVEVPVEPTTGWIAGTVTAGGSPVSGIRVEALAQEPGGAWRAAGSATTDASGAYEIGDLPPDTYRIAFHGGEALVDQFWPGERSADAASTVDLTAGGVVADVDGAMASSSYRASGPLVPTLTTYIPTPADVSTDPAVVSANLALAALVMILFTAAAELLNRTLAENEEVLARALRPARTLRRLGERADAALRHRLGTRRLLIVTRLAGIAVLYGLIFSILDRTWDPLSVTGLWLFLSMALAFGVIGIADDLACWVRARRWGVAVDLDVRTGNLVLALTSTVVSRLVVLVPGIMIGTPEALQVAEDRLDVRRRGQLAATGLITLVGIGGGAWLLTAATAAAQSANPDGDLRRLVGGLEALLLVVFAVAVQNAFAQLLAFRGTAGRALLETHRLSWFLGLFGVTFLFWHTLVNPRGDLATALQSTNVLVFVATGLGFTIVAVAVWAGFRLSRWRGTRSSGTAAPRLG